MTTKSLSTIAIGDSAQGVSSVKIGAGSPLLLFCGPCVIESEASTLEHAKRIREIAERVGLQLVFKSSYDKANRTSAASYRGVGLERGMEILSRVREQVGLPVITDVHSPAEALTAAQVVDIIQIPAFLSRQTDLLHAAGECGKPVMIKKGQFMAPEDMQFAAEKVQGDGAARVCIAERGTCHGYRDLVVDYRSLCIIREMGLPVVFDGTHSVQVMGGSGGSSSGKRQFIAPLTRAAAAVGIDGLFLEAHEEPDRALCDGPNMVPLDELGALLADIKQISELRHGE